MRILVYVLCDRSSRIEDATKVFGQYAWARIITIPTTFWLENVMYLTLLNARRDEWKDVDYVGCISWKASEKIVTTDVLAVVKEVCAATGTKPPDVIPLGCAPYPLIQQATAHHPLFERIWTPVIEALGYHPDYSTLVAFYYNYWLATPQWMDRYIAEFHRFVITLESMPSIQPLLWSDAAYDGRQSDEVCMTIYGVPYYPYHTFLCERFPCVYFHEMGAHISGVLAKEALSRR